MICCILTFISGTNAVLKSLKWKDGDAILIADQTFYAVKNLVKFVTNENKGMSYMDFQRCQSQTIFFIFTFKLKMNINKNLLVNFTV